MSTGLGRPGHPHGPCIPLSATSWPTVLARSAYQPALVETGDDPHREPQAGERSAAAPAAGIVIVPTGGRRRRPPGCWPPSRTQLMRREPAGWSVVGIDDRRARGASHRHPSLGPAGSPTSAALRDCPPAPARLAGFRNALDAAGLPDGARPDPDVTPTAEQGADAERRMLYRRTTSDGAGQRLTPGHSWRPRRAPRPGSTGSGRASVAGFGDGPGWSWWGPGLTTTPSADRRRAPPRSGPAPARDSERPPEESTARALPCPSRCAAALAPPPAASPNLPFPARTGRSSSTADAAPSSMLQRSPR